MRKQFLKYPFTPAGVALWQADLAAAGASARNAEACLVAQSLYSFLPERFTLQAEQVAFLDSLPQALCHLWATQLAYAIREQIAVELVKPEAKPVGNENEGAKFIESEAVAGSQPDAARDGEDHDYLRFSVGY